MTRVGRAGRIVMAMLTMTVASSGVACDRHPGAGTAPTSPRSATSTTPTATPTTPTATPTTPTATPTTPTATPTTPTATTTTPTATTTTPTATLIDLDLVDVPVEDALAEIAHKARVSLSVSSDVTGTVTLRVRAMTWDEAVALIATRHGLHVARTNVMLVVYKHAAPATDTFTGTPIDVRFEDTPIREVARVFAAHAKITIHVDVHVQVAVTQRLRKVPWDFALDHIARKYGLRILRDGDALRIGR